jgi:DNA-repair protein complementing XP-A cells
MTDTKGGFLTQEDDPFNKALHVSDDKEAQKPANMTQREWERQQLLQSLRRNREGPFEPGLSVLDDKSKQKTCRECGSLEIDWKWEEQLRCQICHSCKDKFPDKYSLLTKTEAREDYLLTDRKLNLYLSVSLSSPYTDSFQQPNSATKNYSLILKSLIPTSQPGTA